MYECWLPKLLYQNQPEEKLLQTSAQRWNKVIHHDDIVFFTFFFVACFLDTYCILPNITTTCHTNNYNYYSHITRSKIKRLLFSTKRRQRRIAAGLSLQRARFNQGQLSGEKVALEKFFLWVFQLPPLTVSLPPISATPDSKVLLHQFQLPLTVQYPSPQFQLPPIVQYHPPNPIPIPPSITGATQSKRLTASLNSISL